MKYIFTFIVLLSVTCFAQENKAYVKDGKIVVETAEGARSIDYSGSSGQRYRSLENWQIKEETDTVNNALSVFKKKSEPLYKKKVWIFDRNGRQKILIEYTTDDDDTGLIFSPDEDFVFWVGRSWFGRPTVFGRKLAANKNFIVSGGNNFNLITCNNKQTYVVVKKPIKDGIYYYIHDINGKKKKSCSSSNVCACMGR